MTRSIVFLVLLALVSSALANVIVLDDPTGSVDHLSYSNNEDVSYLISVPGHQDEVTIRLTFTYFEVEEISDCIFDSVNVYDGK